LLDAQYALIAVVLRCLLAGLQGTDTDNFVMAGANLDSLQAGLGINDTAAAR
jgi:hypothetical protein